VPKPGKIVSSRNFIELWLVYEFRRPFRVTANKPYRYTEKAT